MERRRVVVTGMGTVNPLGKDVPVFWDGIKNGRSGIGPITRFDPSDYPTKIAGEVKDFDPTEYMDRKQARKMGLYSQFAMAAAQEALGDAGLAEGGADPEMVGVILGNGIGGFEIMEEGVVLLHGKGPKAVPPLSVPKLMSNACTANIAIRYGFLGPNYVVSTACASATDAIGAAMKAIRYGDADVIVTGGVEAVITTFGISGFNKLLALSTKYNHTPTAASRPFDKDRDGFIMGEGAGVLVLEGLEHALDRGATIYAEVAGYGMSCDAYHITSPHAEGVGPAMSMTKALKDAGMVPEDIDYLNAHGTSTPTNDPLETIAIKKAFGDHAYKMPISSTKSMTAHMVGGAGGVEAIISVMAIQDGFIPPTANLDQPDEGCDLDYVPKVGRKADLRAVLSDSLGFGGHNGSLIVKKFEE